MSVCLKIITTFRLECETKEKLHRIVPCANCFFSFVSSGAVLGREGAGRCLQEPDFQLWRSRARLSAFASREYTSAAAVTAVQAQRPQGVASQQFTFPLKCLKMMFATCGPFQFFFFKGYLILHFYFLFKNFTFFLQERY